MPASEAKRKLAAIFVTDVMGYSRLMGDDPDATVKTLGEYRKVFSGCIQQHLGRVVNAPGDSILAEFESVVDAVGCAIEVQRELGTRNETLPEPRQMHFRIGVNLGDLLIRDGELFGDGVNVAARLEALAEPGGICVSRTVYDQVKSRMSCHFEYLGEHAVKNIAEPVRAYKVAAEGAANKPALSANPSAGAAMARKPSLTLPAKPSIAVLAFENMSADPDQEYFGDGISEDIITDLSHMPSLLVINRHSSFSYKGKQVDIRDIGRELGVRHVLEGSVRKSGGNVRITAQLIEAETGTHVWAQRYDRKLEDIFTVGDEITEEIVTAVDVKLVGGEQARIFRKALKTSRAREDFNKGVDLLYQPTKDNYTIAQELFEEVIRTEPDSPAGYGYAAWTIALGILRGFSGLVSETLEEAERLAHKCLEIDSDFAAGHGALAYCHLIRGQHEQALATAEKSVAAKIVCAGPKAALSFIQLYSGLPADAMKNAREAARQSPVYPAWFIFLQSRAHYQNGETEESLALSKEVVSINPLFLDAHLMVAAAATACGKAQEAEAAVREVKSINPRFSLSEFSKLQFYQDQAVLDQLIGDLSKAGLPE